MHHIQNAFGMFEEINEKYAHAAGLMAMLVILGGCVVSTPVERQYSFIPNIDGSVATPHYACIEDMISC